MPTVDATRQLFELAKAGVATDDLYDVSAAGQRFVLLRDVSEGSTGRATTVVQNWSRNSTATTGKI